MAQTQKPFTIHFVCRGNLYRSRLAAAYASTLLDGRFVVTSSGIEADLNTATKTAATYTQATAKKHRLAHEIKKHKTQTTDQLLQDADVVVFMNKDVYDQALRDYDFDPRKALAWHVADITPEAAAHARSIGTEQALVDAAAHTYAHITQLVNELYPYLTRTAWVDVVDEHNQATSMRLPIAWATDRGLWHRGVHVIVQTTDDKFLVGKRTKSIVFAPGMLEISLGGGIDSGESALEAAQRETHEETGIHLEERKFRPLFTHRRTSFHSHYNKHTRIHVYVYGVKLPLRSTQLRPQPGEVDELRLVSRAELKRLLRTHRLKHFGRLTWNYKFYDKALRYINQPLS
jgi:8-oxo-dGTP pyrophosphatase MutT (NUDIX family)/protein-tyrosine-phosphatase